MCVCVRVFFGSLSSTLISNLVHWVTKSKSKIAQAHSSYYIVQDVRLDTFAACFIIIYAIRSLFSFHSLLLFRCFLLFAIFHFSLYSHQCQVISLHWPGFGLCVRWACRVILKLLVEPMLCISKYATFSKNMRFFDLTIPNKRTHKSRPIRQPHSRMYKIITFQAIYNPVNAGKEETIVPFSLKMKRIAQVRVMPNIYFTIFYGK